MALTVETGTGSATADALWTLAAIDTYHSDRGNATWTGTDAVKEQAIRRGTAWVSEHFTWKGTETHGRDQALAWPRAWVADANGWPIDSDEIPTEVKHATAEAALRELVTPGFFTPDVTLTDRVRREKVGPIETEYATSAATAGATRPVATLITDLVRGLIRGGGGYSGRAVRG